MYLWYLVAKEHIKYKNREDIYSYSTLDCEIIKENYIVVSKPNSDDMLKSYKFGYEVDNPSYKYFKNKQ